MADPTTNSTAVQTAETVGELIATAVGAAFPEEKILLVALQALIRTAPELYVDFVELFSKGRVPTSEEKAAFTADLVKYSDPDAFYKEAAARAGA